MAFLCKAPPVPNHLCRGCATTTWDTVIRLLALSAAWLALAGCTKAASSPPGPHAEARIRFYSAKVSQHPRLYQAYALLAAAYIDKARETPDPALVAQANKALERSMAIQPSFIAFKTLAILFNFTHRFDDALRWAKRAAKVDPDDSSVTAQLVEAYMGQGRYEAAAKLLPSEGVHTRDFYKAAALGHWLASQLRYDEASRAFVAASIIARGDNANDLAAWAEIMAAAALLDGGRAGPARYHLEAAASMSPAGAAVRKELRLHWAELYESECRLEKALSTYEDLLAEQSDPEIHHKAFRVARWLNRDHLAEQHFKAAESGFQRVVDAGEIYTLGALARLYADAGIQLQKARTLAERNLEYKRDRAAEATFAYVRSARWFPRPPIDTTSNPCPAIN